MVFEGTGRICVDLKEMKVNLVTAAFAALPMGSVQSTHHTQSVVLDNPANSNTSINTNGISRSFHGKNAFELQHPKLSLSVGANQRMYLKGTVSH